MSTKNIGFYEKISKLSLNYHQISSNMHLISSSGEYEWFLLLSLRIDSTCNTSYNELRHEKTFFCICKKQKCRPAAL